MTEDFIEEAIRYCKSKTCLCEGKDCATCKELEETEKAAKERNSRE